MYVGNLYGKTFSTFANLSTGNEPNLSRSQKKKEILQVSSSTMELNEKNFFHTDFLFPDL